MSIFTKDFFDEEMARDWTLSESDLKQISTVISSYRLYFAIQRVFNSASGRFPRRYLRPFSPHFLHGTKTMLKGI